jgi:hypothetical protein
VPEEGVVNALRTIHAALVPGGLVVDSQPVSAHPPVDGPSGRLGTLDMRDWARTIAAIDARFEVAFRAGLFAVEAQETLVVTESFDDGHEMLAVVRDWLGTRIPDELERRVAGERGAVQVHQDVRVRLLRAVRP